MGTTRRTRWAPRALALALGASAFAAPPASAVGQPENTAPPVIVGTPQAGKTLSSTTGEWSSTLPVTYSRTWFRCGSAGSATPGATGSTHTLGAADIGRTIFVRVTATNTLGSRDSDSVAVGPVTTDPPKNVEKPTFSGAAREGERLTATSNGKWAGAGPITYARRWRRCDGFGARCVDIPGADGDSYLLTAVDVGHTIRLRVTATGAFGSSEADSDPSAIVSARSGFASPAPTEPPRRRTRPRRMRPFPRVLLTGRVVGSSTQIATFAVRAPRGARISVRCRGRGCPYQSRGYRSGGRRLRLRSMERSFAPGAVIELRITRARTIGKYVRLRFRAGRTPQRTDRCLQPGSARPRRC